MLPPREVPFIGPDGLVALDWYTYLRWHDEEHGGIRTDRMVRSGSVPTVEGASGISGAAGTIALEVDGETYNVVTE